MDKIFVSTNNKKPIETHLFIGLCAQLLIVHSLKYFLEDHAKQVQFKTFYFVFMVKNNMEIVYQVVDNPKYEFNV